VRPGDGLEDNINIDLRHVGKGMDWNNLAEVRDQSWTLVDVSNIMELQCILSVTDTAVYTVSY
jgi:hypothetical protein